jgi:hypothetical protein
MKDDQPLWDLLGRAPRRSAPPFFAARVMRTIEAESAPSPGLRDLLLRWLAPAAVAALVAVAILPRPDTGEAPGMASGDLSTLDLVEMLSPEDYQILTTAGWPYDSSQLTSSL